MSVLLSVCDLVSCLNDFGDGHVSVVVAWVLCIMRVFLSELLN